MLDKINNIVDNKNLNGFENSDKKIFINIYKKYRNNILALLLTLTSIIFIVNLVRYFRKNVVNFAWDGGDGCITRPKFFYISSFLSIKPFINNQYKTASNHDRCNSI